MKTKLRYITLVTLCAIQFGLMPAVFALPQVEDAGDEPPVAAGSATNNTAAYLASAGPVASSDLSENMSPKVSSINDDLLSRLSTLESQVQQLQGRVDELQHALKKSATDSAQQFLILNKKLSDTPLAAPASKTVATPVVAVKASAPVAQSPASTVLTAKTAAELTPDAQEKATYDAAYGLVSAKAYTDAIDAFTGYLNIYPEGKYAANANYWLGELNASQQSYPTALQYLQVVADKYPQSTKAPDALLKMAIINKRLGNDSKAQTLFNQVIKQYPQSASAKSAKEYLN